MQHAIDTGEDLFVEKSREMGVSYTTTALFLWYWLYVPGSNFLVGSRKEDYVDNTRGTSEILTNKEESLFGKLEYMLMRLPHDLRPKGFEFKNHSNYMSLINPELGNIISGESANPNFSRGGRQKAILLDEFAFWDNDAAVWGSTADTTNCRLVVTTPGIRPSKAKRLREGRDGEKIKIVTLTYKLDPRKDDAWVAKQKERRSSEDFAREVLINWDNSITGKVYPEITNKELGEFHYEPGWPLYLSWDFGLDGVAMNWWQINPKNNKPRLIESYFNSNKPIHFYFPLTGQPIDSLYDYTPEDLDAIRAVSQFKKAIHYGDPDVAKRSITSRTLSSTRDELAKVGVYVQSNAKAQKFDNRREKTKVMLQQGIEINSTPRNLHWLECIENARYPQRSEHSTATNAIERPIHDWTSHHRTALEYFCVNYRPDRREFVRRKKYYDPVTGRLLS